MNNVDVLSFRCRHRHSAESHPQCWARYQKGEPTISLQVNRPRHKRPAKVLLLDIETAPMLVYQWRATQEYTPHEMVVQDWSILCYAAKWLFEPEILGESVTAKEAINRKEGSILGNIWRLMNEADIIVTQNGIQFDIKKLNAKFIEHNYNPPSKFLNVDTKVVAKSVFGFSHNKLDFLGKHLLGLDGKVDMEFNDWVECMKGNQAYLDKMLYYCKNDVAPLLEDLYLKLLPWMPNHPNMNVFSDNDTECCRNCGSTDLHWGEKPYATPQGLWMSWRCNSCGATGRGSGKEYKIKSTQIK